MAQVQTQEKPVEYTLQILGSDGKTYRADLKKHRGWLWAQLGIRDLVTRIDKDLQNIHEKIYQLSNLLNVLTDDNKFVSERLSKLILERLPKDNSIRHWDVTKLHPALEVNLHATFTALTLLVSQGKVTEKRGWVRRVNQRRT
jgi:hypothetical protein